MAIHISGNNLTAGGPSGNDETEKTIGYGTMAGQGKSTKAMPVVSVNNPFVSEKDGYVDFVVSLDASSDGEVSVNYVTGDLTAFGGPASDFRNSSGKLVFAPGVTTQTVRVALNHDLDIEQLETFSLWLSAPAGAVVGNPWGVASIVDDDTIADAGNPANLSVRDVVVDASAGTLTFAVVLDKAVTGNFSVAYGTVDGSAQAGSDYVAASGSLNFAPGETVKNITITLPRDDAAEPLEFFGLALGRVSGPASGMVTVANAVGYGSIGAHGQTQKAMPAISVSNPFVGEADGYVDFIVSLDAPSALQTSVYYTLDSMTAVNGVSADYMPTSGNLVFAPGTTTQTVRVPINDDLKTEPLETLAMRIHSPVNAVVANGFGIATIVDNDSMADAANRAGLSVRDVVVDASADTVTFAVFMDKAVSGNVSVAYKTVDGSARAGSDYMASEGILTFAAGETFKHVTVALSQDGQAEAAEMFNLVLGAISGSGAGSAVLARGAGHATIGAHGGTVAALPAISIGDIKVGENNGFAEFTVSLSAPSRSQVSVYYATDAGTASSGLTPDYLGMSGTLVFAPGTTTQTVRVPLKTDTAREALETFTVELSSAKNGTLATSTATATATIVDDSFYHTVKGGALLDTMAYSGAPGSYAIAQAEGGFTITNKNGLGGTDYLVNVERLQFADMNVALDINGIGGQAYRLYQAAFNRTPDAGGLGFWIKAMDAGTSINAVAAGFMQSQEFIQAYGANASNYDLVSKIYTNVLHRPAEAAGLNYWVNALDQNLVSKAEVLAMISESAENQAALAPIIGNGFAYTPYG